MASTTATNGVSSPADYDLMLKLVPHLDRHMIFPLLEFTASQQVDEETGDVKDETKAREVVQATRRRWLQLWKPYLLSFRLFY